MASADHPATVSADGRYVVIDGRRWRASDPSIPAGLRAELVAELMSARRDVATSPDSARPRVQEAKVALGERGVAWWEPTTAGQQARLRAAALVLLRHRRAEATICPSDIARVAGGQRWRGLMDAAREVVAVLGDEGTVVVRQRGQEVDIRQVRGPVRVGRGPGW